ncbi:Flp pilus assembly protein CpaB [Hyphomonas pacifica]|uniref:SAF domain-containing protein n=1 Tax=Hyphomonas pacifica TaxID=1280941 RepID=A0A8B2PS00_9PROT|nr:Flp pilus assembly protein CpaB [Hyphomonas pacifica]RAN34267.1 hypothetical protein HY3_01285 [Hyphomonas pacifica]
MKVTPLLSLGLSAVLGIGAVLLGRYYMTADNNDADAQPQMAAVEMASVLVAASAIEPGEEVTSAQVRSVEWPTNALPEGVLRGAADLETVRYARGLILPGEPIMAAKLDEASNLLTLAAAIEPGMRAVAITVRSDTGVAGFVLPGDRVDVNEFIEKEPGNTATYQDGDQVRVSGKMIARPVLRNVKVLAIDQTFESNMEGAFPSNTVTLEVTPEGALALGAAGTQGALGLALIGRAEEADVVSVVKAEPRKTIVRRSPSRSVTPRTTNVRVINGDKETQVDAPVSKPKTLTEEAS